MIHYSVSIIHFTISRIDCAHPAPTAHVPVLHRIYHVNRLVVIILYHRFIAVLFASLYPLRVIFGILVSGIWGKEGDFDLEVDSISHSACVSRARSHWLWTAWGGFST